MSKIDEIKNRKRKFSPTEAIAKSVDEKRTNNVLSKERTKVIRKRVSFDLDVNLHKELKIQSMVKEKNVYNMVEEAIRDYLKHLE